MRKREKFGRKLRLTFVGYVMLLRTFLVDSNNSTLIYTLDVGIIKEEGNHYTNTVFPNDDKTPSKCPKGMLSKQL